MRFSLRLSPFVLTLLIGTFLVSDFTWAQSSFQDPGDVNLDLNDLSGYTQFSDEKYVGPSEVAAEVMPHLEIIWSNWQFEVGSSRLFEREYSFIVSKVYRFSTSLGAQLELDYRRETSSEGRIPLSDRIGDESFAWSGFVNGGLYTVQFRKANFNVMVSTGSLVEAKAYAKVIESRIETSSGPSNGGISPIIFLVICGAVGILFAIVYVIMTRREKTDKQSALPSSWFNF